MANKRDATFRIEGVDRLVAKLQKMPIAVNRRVQRGALRAGARLILRDAKANIPKRYGHLRRSMAIKTKWYRRTATLVAVVGPRTNYVATEHDRFGNTVTVKPSKYAHLVEYGAAPHMVPYGPKENRRMARHPGARPHAFMRRATFKNEAAVKSLIRTKIREGIKEAARGRGGPKRGGRPVGS